MHAVGTVPTFAIFLGVETGPRWMWLSVAARVWLLENHKGAWVVATPNGVWHRDSQYREVIHRGGTQDTDFDKGKLEDRLQNALDVF